MPFLPAIEEWRKRNRACPPLASTGHNVNSVKANCKTMLEQPTRHHIQMFQVDIDSFRTIMHAESFLE